VAAKLETWKLHQLASNIAFDLMRILEKEAGCASIWEPGKDKWDCSPEAYVRRNEAYAQISRAVETAIELANGPRANRTPNLGSHALLPAGK